MDPGAGLRARGAGSEGYGDFGLRPDLGDTPAGFPGTRRPSLVLCDVQWHDGSPVAPLASPGAERAARMGARKRWASTPTFGSELEFFLFRESYEEAHAQHYGP